MQNIILVSFGYFDNVFLRKIAENIEREFLVSVQIRDGHLDLSDFYNAARRQYDANELLLFMEKHYSLSCSKSLGLFNVDLFIPIFTFIFGQAYLNGNTGIASMYRLSNERYGIIADEDLLLERFSKEIIHELGHSFGLIHCHIADCVMRSVTYVEDIDQKNAEFCQNCQNQLLLKNSI